MDMMPEFQTNLKYLQMSTRRVVDPKVFKKESFVTKKGKECIIPPNSFALARTVEYFKIPENVLVICLENLPTQDAE